MSYLANQKVLNRTPQYNDARTYIKTGDLDGIVHSSTLVELDYKSYTIAILTDEWNQTTNDKYNALKKIHEEVHNIVINHERN
jgi:hypothetical protein